MVLDHLSAQSGGPGTSGVSGRVREASGDAPPPHPCRGCLGKCSHLKRSARRQVRQTVGPPYCVHASLYQYTRANEHFCCFSRHAGRLDNRYTLRIVHVPARHSPSPPQAQARSEPLQVSNCRGCRGHPVGRAPARPRARSAGRPPKMLRELDADGARLVALTRRAVAAAMSNYFRCDV